MDAIDRQVQAILAEAAELDAAEDTARQVEGSGSRKGVPIPPDADAN